MHQKVVRGLAGGDVQIPHVTQQTSSVLRSGSLRGDSIYNVLGSAETNVSETSKNFLLRQLFTQRAFFTWLRQEAET